MNTLTDLKLSESCVGLRHMKKLLKRYRVFNNCNGSWLALEINTFNYLITDINF